VVMVVIEESRFFIMRLDFQIILIFYFSLLD